MMIKLLHTNLHFIIKIAMGWSDDHLHQFRFHGKRYGIARTVEAILASDPHQRYPVCIDGRRACPPEDCGGPWRFIALRQHYDHCHIMDRLLEIIEDGGRHDHQEELETLHFWFHIDRFDLKGASRLLYDYACGENVFAWE